MQSSVPGYSFSNRKYDNYTAPDHGEAPNLSFAVDSYSMEAGRSREVQGGPGRRQYEAVKRNFNSSYWSYSEHLGS